MYKRQGVNNARADKETCAPTLSFTQAQHITLLCGVALLPELGSWAARACARAWTDRQANKQACVLTRFLSHTPNTHIVDTYAKCQIHTRMRATATGNSSNNSKTASCCGCGGNKALEELCTGVALGSCCGAATFPRGTSPDRGEGGGLTARSTDDSSCP